MPNPGAVQAQLPCVQLGFGLRWKAALDRMKFPSNVISQSVLIKGRHAMLKKASCENWAGNG